MTNTVWIVQIEEWIMESQNYKWTIVQPCKDEKTADTFAQAKLMELCEKEPEHPPVCWTFHATVI